MKALILAAGQGSRLSPLTDNKPKCMVEYNNKPILEYALDTLKDNDLDVKIVVGYKKEVIEEFVKDTDIDLFINPDYNVTNMVYSLFCAESELNDDIIISYGDIIYTSEIIDKLVNSEDQISVIVDRKWRELWEIRMENPLEDAETLKLDSNDNIQEIGQKAASYDDIQGQYIGLIKIKKKALKKVKDFYNALDKTAVYEGKNFNNMYMTCFLQLIIDKVMPVKAVHIDGGWIEIDTCQDLNRYSKLNSRFERSN